MKTISKPKRQGKRTIFRKCPHCGSMYAQSEMIRTSKSTSGWLCHSCYNDLFQHEEEEDW